MTSMQLIDELSELQSRLQKTDVIAALDLRYIINRISPNVVGVDRRRYLTNEEVNVVRKQSNYFGPLYGWAHYIRPDAVLARARGVAFVTEARWYNGQRVDTLLVTRKDVPIIRKAQADLAAFFGKRTFDMLLKEWNTECANTNNHKPDWFTIEND